jgi:hypothetical protein
MDMKQLVVLWLATFGLSFAMALTDGPFGFFKRSRTKLKKRFGQEHWISVGVSCPICMSLWVSMALTIASGGGAMDWLSAFGAVCVVTSLSPD